MAEKERFDAIYCTYRAIPTGYRRCQTTLARTFGGVNSHLDLAPFWYKIFSLSVN